MCRTKGSNRPLCCVYKTMKDLVTLFLVSGILASIFKNEEILGILIIGTIIYGFLQMV